MALYLPSEIRENIAVINGIPWGFGRFQAFPYDGLSVEEKLYHIKQAYSFFKNVVKPDLTGCVWLVRKEQSWNEEFAKIRKTCPEENKSEIAQLEDAWIQTFEKEGVQSQYEFIFAIELPIDNPLRQKLAELNPFAADVFQRWIRRFTGVSLQGKSFEYLKHLFQKQTAPYSVEELTAEEIMDFYQKHNYRGLPRPNIKRGNIRRPSSLHFLMPNPIEDCGKYVRIDGAQGSRYVTFLVAALYPEEILAPGFDLLYDIQGLGIPVEVQLWWKQKGYKDAKLFVERKKKTAISNRQHNSEISHYSLADEDVQAQAEVMEREINSTKDPLNEVRLVFCVTAETGEEELDHYVKFLEKYLEDKGITPHQSAADQSAYYDAWCPHARWTPMGFSFPMFPGRSAALAIPGATDQLGDEAGLPKGIITTNGSIFRLDFSYGARSDQTSNIVIVGQSGSGKTHLADDVVRDTLLTLPGRGIYMDVKDEHNHWHKAPGLEGKVQYRVLDGYLNPGILDPFHLIQLVDTDELSEGIDAEEHRLSKAKEIAYDMILQTLGISAEQQNFARQNDVLEAVDLACRSGRPSMAAVVEELKNSPREEAQEMGSYLERIQSLPLGALIFGKVKEGEELQFPRTGLIILGIKNIKLPENNRQAMTISEKISEACMTGISVLVEQFLIEGKQKGVFSFFVGDEGYFYMKSRSGSHQIERNFRLGRSKFCGNIICTQNPSDIPYSLLNHVSTYICLGTKEDNETLEAMKALGVDLENRDVFEELKDLGTKQSLNALKQKIKEREFSEGYVRDLAGRVGRVKFITPQIHVREFFKTRPDFVQQHEKTEKDVSPTEQRVIRV